MAEVQQREENEMGALEALRIDRIVSFLGKCGNADIEAGIGQIFGLGSIEQRISFRNGLIKAIHEPEGGRIC